MESIFKGNRIKELRKQRGLTARQLACMLNVSQSMLTNWENGKVAPRDGEVWFRLADYFGVTEAYLTGLSSESKLQNISIIGGKKIMFRYKIKNGKLEATMMSEGIVAAVSRVEQTFISEGAYPCDVLIAIGFSEKEFVDRAEGIFTVRIEGLSTNESAVCSVYDYGKYRLFTAWDYYGGIES